MRWCRIWILVALPLLPPLTAPGFAEEVQGRLGLGASLSRDLTLSYGVSRSTVVEAGIGFASLPDRLGTVAGDDRKTELFLGGAVRSVVVWGDRADLSAEAGLEFADVDGYVPYEGAPAGAATVWSPRIGLHVRFWLSRHLSLAAAQGIVVDVVRPDAGSSSTGVRSFSGNLTRVSFTYWLDRR